MRALEEGRLPAASPATIDFTLCLVSSLGGWRRGRIVAGVPVSRGRLIDRWFSCSSLLAPLRARVIRPHFARRSNSVVRRTNYGNDRFDRPHPRDLKPDWLRRIV